MANHPLNLAIRFLLETAGLVIFGVWGWQQGGVLPAAVLPLFAASIWGMFRVQSDGGKPVIPVSGAMRLLLEALYFGAAVAAATACWSPAAGARLAGAVLVHYALSFDRILRLLRNNAG